MTIRALPMPKQYGRSYIIIMSIMLIRPAKIPAAEKAAKVPCASRTDARRSLEAFSTFPDISPFRIFVDPKPADTLPRDIRSVADFFKIHRKRPPVKPIPGNFPKKNGPAPARPPAPPAHPRKKVSRKRQMKRRLFSRGDLTKKNQNANVTYRKSHCGIFKQKQSDFPSKGY